LQCRKEERADVSELMRHELFRPRGQVSKKEIIIFLVSFLKKSLQPPSPSAKTGKFDQTECD
jgi:hypothetical protein